MVQPKGPFHFILCRHAVFMYFNQPLRAAALQEMLKRLVPGGYLVSLLLCELCEAWLPRPLLITLSLLLLSCVDR